MNIKIIQGNTTRHKDNVLVYRGPWDIVPRLDEYVYVQGTPCKVWRVEHIIGVQHYDAQVEIYIRDV